MEHKIINTGDYLIVVDDSDIKEGDLYFDIEEKIIYKRVGYLLKLYDIKKIISHLPLNNSPILDGVDILPPLEDEVEKLAKKDAVSIFGNDFSLASLNHQSQFKSGYNKAKEKYKYTEEDIDKAYLAGMKFVGEDKGSYKEFIQSLQQQKTPVAFKCEMVDFEVDMGLGEECVEYSQFPKTTTNSQGLSQWVGEYVY